MKKILLFGAFASALFASEQTELIKKLYEPYLSNDFAKIKANSTLLSKELNKLWDKASKLGADCIGFDPIIDGQDWDNEELKNSLQISQDGDKVVATFKGFNEPKKVEFKLNCESKCEISDIINYYENKPSSFKADLKSCFEEKK